MNPDNAETIAALLDNAKRACWNAADEERTADQRLGALLIAEIQLAQAMRELHHALRTHRTLIGAAA